MPSLEELVASATIHFNDAKPMFPMYAHLIASALFPIVTGAYASLSRPATAARPTNRDDEDDEDADDEAVQKMEGLTPQDAIIFPVTAGLVLASLYWLIKKYGAKVINMVMGYYFAGVGLFSVGKIFNDGVALGLGVLFPTYYAKQGRVWRVDGQEQKVVGEGMKTKYIPLPGWLSELPLPRRMTGWLWDFRAFSRQKYQVEFYVRNVVDVKSLLTILNVVSAFAGVGAIAYNHFIDKPWWLTNLQGFAVSYSAMQLMSPTTFATGSLILGGLFLYDIWAVFFTPLMVTVAKNLDQPIKLLFPRPDIPGKEGEDPTKNFSMLGLGDIVLPGLVIGLALRFDLHMYYLRKQRQVTKISESGEEISEIVKHEYTPATGHFGSRLWTLGLPADRLPTALTATAFPKPYFTASLVGYVIGMLATLGVMTAFQHAQPALLYLVPGVSAFTWGTAVMRGELKEFWNYTEAVNGDAEEDGDEKPKDSETGGEKDSTPTKSWWDAVKGQFIGAPEKAETPQDAEKVKTMADNEPNRLLLFSVHRHSCPRKPRGNNETKTEDSVPACQNTDSGFEELVLVSRDEDAAEDEETMRYPTRRRNPRTLRQVG